MLHRTTPQQAAILTVYAIKRHDAEKGKTTSRARFSTGSIRRLSGRERLRPEFLDEWFDELATLGWIGFPAGDAFGLIEAKAVDGWLRIGTKRLHPDLLRIAIGDDDVWAEIKRVTLPESDLTEPDDE
jgi:hypothetical protein